jgi:CRP-like cAMP-binding protein
MLSTIEKVILLRSVSLFSETPDDILAEVAAIADEQEADAGETIISQGDLGTAMFVIASGEVRVHNGDVTLAVLGERDVFGELAALDPEPRSASVTATRESLLLSVENEALLDLISERLEVARGIIRFLCRRVRAASAAVDSRGAR